jgi:VWFA-related protein
MGRDDRHAAVKRTSMGDQVRGVSRVVGWVMPVAASIGWLAAQNDRPIRVEVKVVNVLCTVYDGRGALVKDLAKEDFEIREDGKPQEIRYFSRETDLPLTIALLVDVSGSVRSFLRAEKDTAVQFFQGVLRKQDQATVTGFSSTVVLWQDFTPSVQLLGFALEGMHAVPFKGLPKDGGPMPTTLLYDAVSSTALNRLKGVSGRKAMVVISDGIDIGSRTNLEEAVRQAQTANAIVYSICYPNPHESGCGYLKSLAAPTGGRMFDLGSKTPVGEIFRVIEAELRSQYAVGFVPFRGESDGSFHKLQVRVRRNGMRVLARKGFYASQ